MNGLWATLPGAALAGLGAVLCTIGYRQIRFQAMTVGICAFAAGGAAIGATIIALLDTRLMTMAWTSASGAALVTHGVFRAIPMLATLPRTQLVWTLAAIFVLLAGGGFAFQLRTTPQEHPTTILAAT